MKAFVEGDPSFDADIPLEQRTVWAVWKAAVRRSPKKRFLWFESGEVWTYEEFDRAVGHAAVGLAPKVSHGDRVGLLMDNGPNLLRFMLAVWAVGAVPAPIHAELRGQLLSDAIERIDPKLMIVDTDCVYESNVWRPLTEMPLSPTELVDVEASGEEAGDPPSGYDHAGLILQTSGTTGSSKACVLSQHMCVYYGWSFWRHMPYSDDDVLYTCLPLYHVHALFASFLPAVMAGGGLAIARRFSASRFWSHIKDSAATSFSALGTMPGILLGQDSQSSEHSHNVRIAHIAPAPARTNEFQDRFNVRVVSALYGLTEAMIFPPDSSEEPQFGLIGRAPADWDIRLVDTKDQEVPLGVAGELIVRPRRSFIMFEEYLGDPVATVNAWRGLWFRTGDLCRQEEDGRYWFVARSQDMLRRSGENISANELEGIISGMPELQETAVLGLRESVGSDDTIVAVVVPSHEVELSSDRVMAYCQEAVPRFMRPDAVLTLEGELPKQPNGKLDIQRLREFARNSVMSE